ncbi:ead/Ea22-like family protein [Escherichia marmotae]|nr:ead/Ea22-like family protein [Escherichia marmotae]MDQ9243194.1 ead/Ea22-like family protein [Escherichia marmotae]MDQ9277336.1 ead/Ea22-like family protein [Escherichia marmotae]
MNKIDYQALREAAEKAGEDKWQAKKINGDFFVIRHGSYTRQHGYTSYQPIAEIDCKPVRDFVAKANPATVLALLDERERNQQYIKRRDQENEDIALTVGKLRVELEAAKKRIAELEAEPVSQTYKLNELSGNSPVTPDGWVMVPKELTPEMMRAVQIRSELGGYATSNLSGAYNMFSEFWNVAVSAAPKVDDL